MSAWYWWCWMSAWYWWCWMSAWYWWCWMSAWYWWCWRSVCKATTPGNEKKCWLTAVVFACRAVIIDTAMVVCTCTCAHWVKVRNTAHCTVAVTQHTCSDTSGAHHALAHSAAHAVGGKYATQHTAPSACSDSAHMQWHMQAGAHQCKHLSLSHTHTHTPVHTLHEGSLSARCECRDAAASSDTSTTRALCKTRTHTHTLWAGHCMGSPCTCSG
jgi:hypothetical protein